MARLTGLALSTAPPAVSPEATIPAVRAWLKRTRLGLKLRRSRKPSYPSGRSTPTWAGRICGDRSGRERELASDSRRWRVLRSSSLRTSSRYTARARPGVCWESHFPCGLAGSAMARARRVRAAAPAASRLRGPGFPCGPLLALARQVIPPARPRLRPGLRPRLLRTRGCSTP